MPTGTIKFYNTDKGYGFILQENGEDIFFHIYSFNETPENLTLGQPVSFEIKEGRKGQEAKQITLQGEAPAELTQKLKIKPKKKKRQKYVSDLYMEKQIRLKTPMVFEAYTESIPCTIKKNLVYTIDLLCLPAQTGKEEAQRIQKHDIKYCYKQEYEQAVQANIQFDEAIKAQALQPIVPRKDRYKIERELLLKARNEKTPIRLVLRGGEIIQGNVDWFSSYEIKVEFQNKGNVIAYHHAVYDFAIENGEEQKTKQQPQKETPQEVKPKEPPQEETPQIVKDKEKAENTVKVSITTQQAAQGAKVAIPTPNGKKIAIRLPAGTSNNKRFRIKKLNLILIVSVEDA